MLYLSKSFETVGSAETGPAMSRPQFNQNTQANTQGSQGVVNGGLIDFQDNGFRGVNEQLSAGYPLPQGYPAQGYPQQQQAMYPGQALPAALQGYNPHALGASAGGGACFSGPPTFLHVNGITYKPVSSDPQAAVEADPRAAAASAGAVTTTQPAPTPAHQVLTAEELADIVNERVQTQVDSYLKTQHGHHHSNKARSKHVAAQEPQQLHHHKTMSAAGGSRALTHEESIAVQRVCQANANIKHVVAGGGGNKPAASGGNRW
jgi:hypothetical protein